MKHLKVYGDYILESVMSIDDIYNKYYRHISRFIFNELIAKDPTIDLIGRPNKMGMYCKWLLKLYDSKNLKPEDFYKALRYLTIFHRFKQKLAIKDINKIKTLPDLYELIEPYTDKRGMIFTNEEERMLTGEFKEVFKSSKFRIVIPLTLKASQYFAKGTEWCTKYPDNFKSYTEKQTSEITPYNLYIFLTADPKERLQFHFDERQFMDYRDKPIRIEQFLEENKDVYEFFNQHFDVRKYAWDLDDWLKEFCKVYNLTGYDIYTPVFGDCYDNGNVWKYVIAVKKKKTITLFDKFLDKNGVDYEVYDIDDEAFPEDKNFEYTVYLRREEEEGV